MCPRNQPSTNSVILACPRSDATTEYSRRLAARSEKIRVLQPRARRRRERDSGGPDGTPKQPDRVSTDEYTYARTDPAVTADRIFKHVVTAGYMEEPVAPLSLPLTVSPRSVSLSNESRHARKVSSAPRANARVTKIIRRTRWDDERNV